MRAPFTALTRGELAAALGSDTRARAALRAVYERADARQGAGLAPLPAAVPEIAEARWEALREAHPLPALEVVRQVQSADGTLKLLVSLGDCEVETVLIPGPRRSTVCVSSQAGCTRACRFCATATLPFRRQLGAGEIVGQYLLARALAPPERPATHVVFMGMGEPLDNLDEVVRAVEVLTTSPGPALSPRHVTVSTSGVLPKIGPFLARSRANLALSVNATTAAQRQALMPHDRSWPLETLIEACREELGGGRRLLFVEYILIEGVNDRPEDMARLIALLEGVPCRVNLIPLNETPGGEYRATAPALAEALRQQLLRAGLRATLRQPKGADSAAACGQLAGAPQPPR